MSLRSVVGPLHAVSPPATLGNAVVWMLDAQDGGRYVAKYATEAWQRPVLQREGRVLARLAPFHPLVPEVVATTEDGWLVMTRLNGHDLADLFGPAGPAERCAIAAAFGQALALIHTWEPEGFDRPAPGEWTARLLERCQENVHTPGYIDTGMWHRSRFADTSPQDLMARLETDANRLSATEEIVFGHGDWCLPNALAVDATSPVTGVIDWGDGGWQDRRWDLATGLRTLRRNGSVDAELPSYLDAFLESYGVPTVPEELEMLEAAYALS